MVGWESTGEREEDSRMGENTPGSWPIAIHSTQQINIYPVRRIIAISLGGLVPIRTHSFLCLL